MHFVVEFGMLLEEVGKNENQDRTEPYKKRRSPVEGRVTAGLCFMKKLSCKRLFVFIFLWLVYGSNVSSVWLSCEHFVNISACQKQKNYHKRKAGLCA